MDTRNQAITGGLLVLCSVSVDKGANRIAFTPTRLHNPGQPSQDWRGIKVDGGPFYLDAKDKDSLAQLEQQFETGREYGMQIGPVAANIGSHDNKS